MKKITQIKEDGEDNKEHGKNVFKTPVMPAIQELKFAPLQTFFEACIGQALEP